MPHRKLGRFSPSPQRPPPALCRSARRSAMRPNPRRPPPQPSRARLVVEAHARAHARRRRLPRAAAAQESRRARAARAASSTKRLPAFCAGVAQRADRAPSSPPPPPPTTSCPATGTFAPRGSGGASRARPPRSLAQSRRARGAPAGTSSPPGERLERARRVGVVALSGWQHARRLRGARGGRRPRSSTGSPRRSAVGFGSRSRSKWLEALRMPWMVAIFLRGALCCVVELADLSPPHRFGNHEVQK